MTESNAIIQGSKTTPKDNKEELIQKITRSKEDTEKAYKELQESKDRLVQSEKMAFAGRMAASVAHEIRNPLSMLVMSVQLLQNKLSKKDARRELVDVIMRNLERIDHLVDELVNCARPPKLKMRNYNISTIIDTVIGTVKEKCKTQHIKVDKDYNPDIPKVRIDREHVEQAILNIVKNAIEAMPKGGALSISTNYIEGYILVSIKNTGKSIPERDIIKIFDPFFTTKKGGTGLGLSICYSIIASHNGFISLRSKRRETCFTIKLPI